jgi:nitrite reductase/ring-hydroxylating ferredoxin subunit
MYQSDDLMGWWKVARSEEVSSRKPLSVDLGDQPLVLWRDAGGVARALEDRCPHRRAPLSLGCIKENGSIQCGYHGWTYEGESGRLKEIPNMKDQQKFPPTYRAKAFAVVESGGFVSVNLDANAVPPEPSSEVMVQSGTSHVALEHGHYLDALFDDPGLVIAIRGVQFTPYLMSELQERDGWLEMERFCHWGKLHLPSYASAEFPISLVSRTDIRTGETELELRDDEFRTLMRVRLAPVPAARGVTQIRWRVGFGQELVTRQARNLRGPHFFVAKQAIDAAALRTLKPSVSLHGHKLRDMTKHDLASSATRQVA